jgi:hypothetical protein
MMQINNSRLIVINPNPDEALENLYQHSHENIKWKIPKQRLFKFSGKFGSEEVFKYLSRIERVSINQDTTFGPTQLEQLK